MGRTRGDVADRPAGGGGGGGRGWAAAVLLGVAVRVAALLAAPDALRKRPELVTPVTRMDNLAESVFLAESGLSPYAGDFYRGPPLLHAAARLAAAAPGGLEAWAAAALVLADVLVAAAVRSLARRVAGRRWGDAAGAWSLLNPVGVLQCAARSTGALPHLAAVLALLAASRGRAGAAGAALAVAAALDPYAALLLPAAALMLGGGARRAASLLAAAAAAAAALTGASEAVRAGGPAPRDWFARTAGFALLAPDHAPNVGAFWYFFQLIFPRFRGYFLVLFNAQLVACAVPLAVRFRARPAFAAYATAALAAAFKSYPAAGDVAFSAALLVPHLPRLAPHARRVTRVVLWVWLTNCLVGLNQWWMWTGSGAGNANFFYFQTVLFLFCHSFVVLEAVSCARKADAGV